MSNLTPSNVISWIVLGFVAGLIMHLLDRREVKGGIIATTIFGIIGAIVGGALTSFFLGVGVSGLNIPSLLIAVGGGLLIAMLQRIISGTRERNYPARYDYERGRVAYYSQVTPLHTSSQDQYQDRNTQPQRPKVVRPIELEKYLAGIEYPVTKGQLIEHALRLDAGEDVLYTLESLPDKVYNGPISVSQEIEKFQLNYS